MAEIRPFRGLRYQSPDLADLIAPPYDVITPADQEALYGRSPHNVVRLELPRGGEAAYGEAAATLARWRAAGVLGREERAAFYLYDLEFPLFPARPSPFGDFPPQGRSYRRRSLLGRLGLEPWERGVVLPHEATLAAPKEDRLKLLRACRTQISPVFALYRDRQGRAAAALAQAPWRELVAFADRDGCRHTLRGLAEPAAQAALTTALGAETLYIADGHHRYETALAYRQERRAGALAPQEGAPEDYVLAALTAAADPGLLILPIHRLVAPPAPPELGARLAPYFRLEPAADLEALLAAMGQARDLCYGLLEPEGLHLLSAQDRAGLEALLPAGCPPVWRRLEVALLQYAVLGGLLGIPEGALGYTEDAQQVWEGVRAEAYAAAFLLRPLRPEDVFMVAEAGARMPPKSTFFYPKLPTGLVLNGLDA